MPEQQSQPSLKIIERGSIRVVEFEDRKILEELAINQIGQQLSHLVLDEDRPKLLLDFRNVQHLSSAALGMLITLNKQVSERQGQLVLANINAQIYEVFKITKLNKLFNIQDTMDGALAVFA